VVSTERQEAMHVIAYILVGPLLLAGHMTCAVLRSRAYRRKAERRIAALREGA